MKKDITCCLSRYSIFFTGLILVTIACLTACKKESNNDPTPTKPALAGNYILKSATVTKNASATIQENKTTIKKGTDITDKVKMILFSKPTCKDKNNKGVDLRENKEMYFNCVGDSSSTLKAGTWDLSDDNKALSLNLAPPVIPVAYTLLLKDVKIGNDTLSGNTINMPIPAWVILDSNRPQDLTDFKNPLNTPVPLDAHILLEKQP